MTNVLPTEQYNMVERGRGDLSNGMTVELRFEYTQKQPREGLIEDPSRQREQQVQREALSNNKGIRGA